MPDTVGKLFGVFGVHVRDLVAHDTSGIECASALGSEEGQEVQPQSQDTILRREIRIFQFLY